MGAGLIDAAQLLNLVKNKDYSSDMKLPNIYVALDKVSTLNLPSYFEGVESGYTCAVGDANVASATIEGTTLTVKGLAVGSTTLTVSVGGKLQTVSIIVRKNASNNGWM